MTSLFRAGVPPVPPIVVFWLQLIWGGLTAAVTAAIIANHVLQRRQGAMPSLVKLMAMVSGLGFWWFTMVNTRDLLLAILLFELYHALQSLFLVRAARHTGVRGRPPGWATGPPVISSGGRVSSAWVVCTFLYGLPAYLAGASPWAIAGRYRLVVAAVGPGVGGRVHDVAFLPGGYAWRLREEGVRADFRIADGPDEAGSGRVDDSAASGVQCGLLMVLLAAHGVAAATDENGRGGSLSGSCSW